MKVPLHKKRSRQLTVQATLLSFDYRTDTGAMQGKKGLFPSEAQPQSPSFPLTVPFAFSLPGFLVSKHEGFFAVTTSENLVSTMSS